MLCECACIFWSLCWVGAIFVVLRISLSTVAAVACYLLFYALLRRIRFRPVICFECQLPCSLVRRLSLHCTVTAAGRPLHCPALPSAPPHPSLHSDRCSLVRRPTHPSLRSGRCCPTPLLPSALPHPSLHSACPLHCSLGRHHMQRSDSCYLFPPLPS